MKHIYQGADRGIFYLSPHAPITEVIMESLTLLQKQVAGSRWAPNDERWDTAWHTVQAGMRSQYDDLETRQREGLAYLLLSPFFKRVWILQEVASVRRASVFCGTCSVHAHIFAIGAQIEEETTNTHISAVIQLMQKSLETTTNPLQGKSLAALLIQFSESDASDERDKIYALLGLYEARENAKELNPDYTRSIRRVIKLTLRHIYGKYITNYLRNVDTIHLLIYQLKEPPSDVIERLAWSEDSQETVFDYINGTEAPVEISDELAMKVLEHLVRSSRWPIEVLHKIFAWLGKQLDVIPYKIVGSAMGKEWSVEVLELLCQYGRKVFVPVRCSFVQKIRHTKIPKTLIEPCKAEIIIRVTMRGLWIMLLLSDDDTKALIPLIHGASSPAKAVVTHLRAAASPLVGSFGNRDAVMLLWRLTGDTKSGHANNTASIMGSGRLGLRCRMSLNSNQMAGEYEGTAELTSSSLRHPFSGRPISMDSQLDLSPAEKWRPDMSNFNSYSRLCGVRGRSQSI
ncbi:hypothetical protein F4782DRAFT_235989 [Xylaria castorea]|nr:hypothetical protein F4782DRAFT_235989 [Xylaria castorea]